jgi:4-amino-4-deoxy-L-arabinose transferase-like glycosyltransferase
MTIAYKKHFSPILWLTIVLILFSGNQLISLWDQDEAAYAGFALNMLESDNWVVPDFMWSEVHRKTPLHFWNIALSYKLFGINEFSVRFPSSLMIFLTYVSIYIGAKPLFGDKTSIRSVVILCTSFFINSLAKISVTDATVLFFSTLCALAVLHILQYRSWWAVLVFWISFSLALLTKGPPIIVFMGIFVALLFITHPYRKNLWILHPWFFAPLALIPVAAWTWATSQQEGGTEFLSWMLDWYVLKRINDSVFGQTGPPGTHFLGLILFFIPYFMFLPKAFSTAFRSFFKDKGTDLLLGSWFIASWFIYEWTPSKLPAYVVAAHIPLALLISKSLNTYEEQGLRPHKIWFIIQGILLAIIYSALLVVPYILKLPLYTRWLFGFSSILLLIGLSITIFLYKTKHFFKVLFALNLSFQVLAWVLLLPHIDSFKDSSKRIGLYTAAHAKKSSTVLIANDHGHPPSLPFYLRLNFGEVREEYDSEALIQKYMSKKPHVLILNEDLKAKALESIPNLHYETISAVLIDRNQQAHYYIAINEAARLQMIGETASK